jgi:hypothetical protein
LKIQIKKICYLTLAVFTLTCVSYYKGKEDGANAFIRAANKKIYSCVQLLVSHDRRTRKIDESAFLPSSYFLNETNN